VISCLFTVQKGSKKHITRPNYSIPGTIFSRIDFLESQTSILLQDMVRFNGDRFITWTGQSPSVSSDERRTGHYIGQEGGSGGCRNLGGVISVLTHVSTLKCRENHESGLKFELRGDPRDPGGLGVPLKFVFWLYTHVSTLKCRENHESGLKFEFRWTSAIPGDYRCPTKISFLTLYTCCLTKMSWKSRIRARIWIMVEPGDPGGLGVPLKLVFWLYTHVSTLKCCENRESGLKFEFWGTSETPGIRRPTKIWFSAWYTCFYS
jgi:hypothetical protein